MEAIWQGDTLHLHSGEVLKDYKLSYWTNAPYREGQKIVLISHALTANAKADEWWSALAAEGGLFGQKDYHLICINHLGSHYGSTNPLSENPETKEAYYQDFPEISIKDLAQAQWQCLQALGYPQIDLLIGASLGGQVALELGLLLGSQCKALCLIASNAFHSAWGIAFNETQRQAITLDPTWGERQPEAGKKGMALARATALLSYRTYHAYKQRQGREIGERGIFRAAEYQAYQGEKLAARFNAYSYWYLSKAMDSHQLGANEAQQILRLMEFHQPSLVIGIKDDLLFPWSEQEFLAQHLPNARLLELSSKDGHDGFLIEAEALAEIISLQLDFLKLESKHNQYENSINRSWYRRASLL